MMEKYGLFIAVFIFALCVHSNIILENPLLQTAVKTVSLVVMVAAGVGAFAKSLKQPS
ncbi:MULTISPECIES: hypothetical protein [Bacillus]|uniref:hypothetical protein n=1 Tax=Bacillus TaxID=1386 RepID=UPI000814C7E4|nr:MULTISPECIES: hypothetical protein [Bacillus]MBU8788552.1 hypothetical protein [Bacillus glycinifermentans]MDU0073664.1 hypothetical protein [Bacillus sp. IG6]MED8021536.1 hypothetical protein [Bacillus glycinifermentans]WKB76422.1 hypothetical protein QYM22_18910 [Bacillus glycinifermentans]SCA87502.1 putative membrane protein [Bacillus glycinifermentans]